MSDVLIFQRATLCHVFCECGYVGRFDAAPEMCPICGGAWDAPRVEHLHPRRDDGMRLEKTAVSDPA